MKNTAHVNEIKFDELTQEEYTFDEIAALLGTSRGRVYYNVNKFCVPSRRVRGKDYFTKDSVVYLMKCINKYIDSSIFHKRSSLYPSRRRRGKYSDYYRPREVMFILGLSETELAALVADNELEFTPFSKHGEKRGGYAIEQVKDYAVRVGKTRYIWQT